MQNQKESHGGLENNGAISVENTREAAEQGHTDAQFNLACMYLNGRGVAQDNFKAVEWFRKAAEQGEVQAQFNLASMYAEGIGIEKDEATAVEWYTKAAKQGLADAQFCLALLYEEGRGVEKDEATAVKWYRKAAEQGHADAQNNLAVVPENVIAQKLTFVEPYCSNLSPQNADLLRQNAVRSLRLLYRLKAIPANAPPTDKAMKALFLDTTVRNTSAYWSTQLAAIEGATDEDKRKAYIIRESALFDSDPDQWWQHRVRDSYDFFVFNQTTTRHSSGCILPILLTGAGLISWHFIK